MQKIFFLSIFFIYSSVLTNMAPEGFERFPNHYFVETGTYAGDGIKFALRAKFNEIYSIEIDQILFRNATKKFAANKNVHVSLGDSGVMLWEVIKNLDKPITFWLDGHCGTPRKDGGKNTPLIEELEQIKAAIEQETE